MSEGFKIYVNSKLYLKDPEGSVLGRKIIGDSIHLIDKIGFEAFTFRKLAEEIHSTEASIYRYFENKHKLLVYLINWYWSWLELNLLFEFSTMHDPEEKLKSAIALFTGPIQKDERIAHIDEVVLHRIIIQEYSKAYLTKNIDTENREGYFQAYKSLCLLLASLVQSINPSYPYPNSLMSTAIESSMAQQFFSTHIPALSDVNQKNCHLQLNEFIKHLVFNTIHPS